jgi:hypothetical protein
VGDLVGDDPNHGPPNRGGAVRRRIAVNLALFCAAMPTAHTVWNQFTSGAIRQAHSSSAEAPSGFTRPITGQGSYRGGRRGIGSLPECPQGVR